MISNSLSQVFGIILLDIWIIHPCYSVFTFALLLMSLEMSRNSRQDPNRMAVNAIQEPEQVFHAHVDKIKLFCCMFWIVILLEERYS